MNICDAQPCQFLHAKAKAWQYALCTTQALPYDTAGLIIITLCQHVGKYLSVTIEAP